MDHHCNFMGVCVYSLNTKWYILFLLANLIYCLFNIGYLLLNVGLVFRRESLLRITIGGIFGLVCFWRIWEDWVLLHNQY